MAVMLVISVMGGIAQDSEQGRSLSLGELRLGMTTSAVASVLGQRYELLKGKLGDGDEWWFVGDRAHGKREGELLFTSGKLDSIAISLDEQRGDDAVRLAIAIFRLLYNDAQPPPNPSRVERLVSQRQMSINVEVQRVDEDSFSERRIFLNLPDTGLVRITIRDRSEKVPAGVEIHRII